MTTQPEVGFVPEFTVGDRLRKARELAGYEQGPFAALMGVSRGTISNYERNTGTKAPRRIVLDQWSAKTGVSLHWLETGQDEPHSPTPPPRGGQKDDAALARLTQRKRGRARRPATNEYDVAA